MAELVGFPQPVPLTDHLNPKNTLKENFSQNIHHHAVNFTKNPVRCQITSVPRLHYKDSQKSCENTSEFS